jgi:hypothetical protein
MRRWPTLEEELAELERTDPVVREARRKYDETCASILAKRPPPRAFDSQAILALVEDS